MAESGSMSDDCCDDFDELPQRDQQSDVEIASDDSRNDSSSDDEPGIETDSDDDDALEDLIPLVQLQKWRKNIRPTTVDAFDHPVVPFPGDNVDSPKDFFSLMFHDEMFDTIATETNRYARQSIEKSLHTPGGKGDPLWEKQGDSTGSEIRAFFAVMILMGIHKLPSVDDYWSSDSRLNVQGVCSIMPIQRWRKLNQYLHLVDNSQAPDPTDPNRDRLHKVRPLVDMCNAQFKNGTYQPHRELSIDEAMIGFKGRSLLKQYVPAKPTKWGLKAWVLADSHNGYCLHAEMYTGAKDSQGRKEGLGYRVVMDLARHVSGKNHHIFFDNYFTCPKLMVDLLHINTYARGTVRSNRKGLPPSFRAKSAVNRGTTQMFQRGRVLAVQWRDNKDVFVLATNGSSEIGDAQRRIGSVQTAISCPQVIKTYNKFMGGVDLCDQARSYYPVGRKARKYWKYILWFFVDVCLNNAWLIYRDAVKEKPKKKYSAKDFRLDVCSGLVAGFTSRKRQLSQNRVLAGVVADENMGAHVLAKFAGRRRVCVQCSKKKRKTERGGPVESSFGCVICNVNLCRSGCHAEFHSQ